MLALLCACVPSSAQPASTPPAPFDDIYHNSWTVREGVPPVLWQAKQTPDGFLWLAAETGLYRFDGIAFTKYVPTNGQKLLKDGPITGLTATADGGLWIAYRFGGVSFLHAGTVTNYPATPAFSETIFVLTQDSDGVIWGASAIGLFRFDGKQWSRVDESWGQTISRVAHLKLTPSGDLWVDDSKTYYVLPKGSRHFQPTGLPNGKLDLTGPDTGWLSQDKVGLFPVTRRPDDSWTLGKQLLKENISSITHTPDGALWFGAHDGIWRIRDIDSYRNSPLPPGALQSMQKTDGLTADFVYALTVDREGSIWALTPNGLDQFRKTALTTVALPPDLQHSFLVDEGTSVLTGAGFSSLTPLARTTSRGTELIPAPLLTAGIHQIYRDPSGTVWINTGGKLARLNGTTLTPVEGPRTCPRAT